MDVLAFLHNEMDTLSRSEQRIAQTLFDDTPFAINASIIELAAKAGVSPPTVTRFCRRLGCQSYSEFKVRLAQTSFVGTRYLKPETKASSGAEIIEDIASKAQNAIYLAHTALHAPQLEAIAARLAKAGMIYAFGSGGNSSIISAEIQNRLFRLGLRVTACTDHTMQLMLASAVRPDDVIIASSFSGRNLELAAALQVGRSYKAFTIAMTSPGSPVADAVDSVVPIDLQEGVNILRPTSTRYAFLLAVDALANLTAAKLGTSAVEPLRRIKHQLVTHRDTNDEEPLGD